MAGKTEKTGSANNQMTVSLRRHLIFWVAAAVVFILFLYLFRSILLPFVAGLALAYILDPVADRLERLGFSRLMATITILIAFLVLFLIALMIIVPVLASQLVGLIERLPSYVDSIQSLLTHFNTSWLERTIGVSAGTIHENLNSLITQGAGFLTTLLKQIWNSGMALINIAALFLVTPVVAFYMLNDWDRMVAQVDSWVPRDQLDDVRQISRDIDRAVAGFVRGQGAVCVVLGLIYAVGLTLIGLNFGLLIGLFAGVISFIPYVGSTVGLVLAIGVGLIQFWPDWPMVAGVALIFFVGQFIEGNILQPKLVGNRVGLHPVWLMFALFAFGSLLGFVGMMVAVPCAAAVAVLMRFAIDKYLKSPLYRGGSGSGD